jgi:hypothetical protein
LGIPLSIFRGRVPVDGESYWTPLDRNYALAWQQEKRATHTCGQPVAESTARENQFRYRAEVIRCHACAALDRAVSEHTRQDGADTAGIQARLTLTPHGAI